ncbi:hypothetical protein LEMLEM_LOCUS6985 [Lemmus lemmus]
MRQDLQSPRIRLCKGSGECGETILSEDASWGRGEVQVFVARQLKTSF